MKQIKAAIFALCLLIVIPASLSAQQGFKLGILALPQNTWLLNQDDLNAPKSIYEHKISFGMSAGFMAGYNFGDGIGLRMNLLYSLQGQRYSSLNSKLEPVENHIRLQYIKVPLMLAFNTRTEYSKMVFAFAVGYHAGLLLNARYYNDDQTYIPDQVLWTDVLSYPSTTKTYSRFVHGPTAEFGVDMKLTYNIMANVRLRGDYTLMDSENKNATVTRLVNGVVQRDSYWGEKRPATNQITGGIMLGLTYTFSSY